MSDVEFNEPSYASSPQVQASKEPSRLSKLIIKSGFAKDEKSAQLVLLVSALICIAIAGAVFFMGSPSTPESPAVTVPVPV